MATADGPIVFISESAVRPGMADAARTFLADGVPQLEAAKPQTVAFLGYLDEAATTLTIVHVFADAAALAAHVEGADGRSAAADELIETRALTIFGKPHPETVAAIASSTNEDVPVEVRGPFVGGFLRLRGGRPGR